MVGITSYGAYVPMLRLPLAAIAGGGPKTRSGGGGGKAVANFDEDRVTMAGAAVFHQKEKAGRHPGRQGLGSAPRCPRGGLCRFAARRDDRVAGRDRLR